MTLKDIKDYAATLEFNRFGEDNHALLPVVGETAYASIWPEIGADSQSADELATGRIIARITASRDYGRLGLKKGPNYFWVYRDDKMHYRGVIVPEVEDAPRTEIQNFQYRRHFVDQQAVRLAPAVIECQTKKLKACFVDSDTYQVAPPPMSGGQSLPWTWCSMFGCCCGGSECHPSSGKGDKGP